MRNQRRVDLARVQVLLAVGYSWVERHKLTDTDTNWDEPLEASRIALMGQALWDSLAA